MIISKTTVLRTLLLLLVVYCTVQEICDFAISLNTHDVPLKSRPKTLLTKTLKPVELQ
jgi:hypothetical protein